MVQLSIISTRSDYGFPPDRWQAIIWGEFDGLVQDCSNSIAKALELLQSCTKPSIFVTNVWSSQLDEFIQLVLRVAGQTTGFHISMTDCKTMVYPEHLVLSHTFRHIIKNKIMQTTNGYVIWGTWGTRCLGLLSVNAFYRNFEWGFWRKKMNTNFIRARHAFILWTGTYQIIL